MKRIFLAVFLVLMVANGAMAQEQAFGLQLGYAQPTLREPNLDDANLNYKTKLGNVTRMPGFNFGVVYEGTIVKGFGTFFALDYNFGANVSEWKSVKPQSVMPQSRNKVYYHSLSLRSDWQYKFTVAKETYLLLYTGPVIGVNMSMKNTTERKDINPMTNKEEMSISTVERFTKQDGMEIDHTQLLRYNILWGVGAGFQYKKYFVRGGYDFGLTSEYKNHKFPRLDGVSANYRCRLDNWHVSLGIYLWQN